MYHNSSQRRHWTFASEEQLARLRADANRKFKCKVVANGKVLPNDPVFLEPPEEMTLCKYYEKRLLEFCSVFKPAMPRSVVGTACMYFKRFYLNNSVMEYHPRTIMPFEGFLIDLKTRYPMVENPEMLRKTADDFLNRIALTDAYLLYTPSQIALTAILSSASRAGIAMESYLSESLMLRENRTCLSQLLDIMKSMRNLVKKYEPPRPEEVAVLKQKLERCHSAELALNVAMKKRKGYEDDDYVAKKARQEEEDWTDDDLVDSI
ncbi:cyclin-H isoform X4 [Ochotona curzoniae]|uniref:cyclin-H isoform X4 n=1 Tax=Ochotona curzoniae TaxID=130825 RepID=UPI001B346869|nr:cyclin-H isoform X4 [Ochotona curzoniae]